MKVISTVNWEDHLTEGKEYEVLYMWKYKRRGRKGNNIYGYQVTMENGENMWMFPEEGYVPLKTKKNVPWRKILKAKGYKKKTRKGYDWYIEVHEYMEFYETDENERLLSSVKYQGVKKIYETELIKHMLNMKEVVEVIRLG